MTSRADAIVIGAGAAGLSTARDLSEAGLSVVVLEARERAGGRIATVRDPIWPVPVELGPEFIHGRPGATFGIFDATGIVAVRLANVQWVRGPRGWRRREDYWETADAITSRMRDRGPDRSVAEFLKAHPKLSSARRELLLALVEGYDAAFPDRLGERSISTRGQKPESHDQFRVLNGYDRVTSWLARASGPGSVETRFGRVVTTIRWKGRSVEIETAAACGRERWTAPCAIVTIPVGVWKAGPEAEGAIRFEPDLPEKRRALRKIEMGPVVKVVLRFREKFWKDGSGSNGEGARASNSPRLGFLSARGESFPTWWSAEPVEVPILTAWAGGPAAAAFASVPAEEIAGRAVRSLASLLSIPERRIASRLEAWRMHDWQSDPFSRGAYSYLGIGGVPARRALARPVARTLFFAGEATDPEQSGTVAGAIDSGRRAAREVVKSRSRGRHIS